MAAIAEPTDDLTVAQPTKTARDIASQRHARPLSKLKCTFGATITVLVGPNQNCQSFGVHPDLLKAQSEFFRAALEGDWKEKQDGVIKLPEDDARLFNIFVNWLYRPEFDITQAIDEGQHSHLTLAKCYALGDKLQSLGSKNAVLDAFGKQAWMPNDETIIWAHDHLPPRDKLLQLFADLFAWEGLPNIIRELDHDVLPKAFLAACLKGVATAVEVYYIDPDTRFTAGIDWSPVKIRLCETYHEHPPGAGKRCANPVSKQRTTESTQNGSSLEGPEGDTA